MKLLLQLLVTIATDAAVVRSARSKSESVVGADGTQDSIEAYHPPGMALAHSQVPGLANPAMNPAFGGPVVGPAGLATRAFGGRPAVGTPIMRATRDAMSGETPFAGLFDSPAEAKYVDLFEHAPRTAGVYMNDDIAPPGGDPDELGTIFDVPEVQEDDRPDVQEDDRRPDHVDMPDEPKERHMGNGVSGRAMGHRRGGSPKMMVPGDDDFEYFYPPRGPIDPMMPPPDERRDPLALPSTFMFLPEGTKGKIQPTREIMRKAEQNRLAKLREQYVNEVTGLQDVIDRMWEQEGVTPREIAHRIGNMRNDIERKFKRLTEPWGPQDAMQKFVREQQEMIHTFHADQLYEAYQGMGLSEDQIWEQIILQAVEPVVFKPK